MADTEVTDLEKKIIRQIEFYFGDHNLPNDKFLKETIKESEDGWVPMATMLKFKRLADLSTDTKAIVTAIGKSKSGLMEATGEGDEAKVRRSPSMPLPENPENVQKERQERTAYAKGFDKEKTTLSELLEYFAEHDPSVVYIKFRTYIIDKDKTKTQHFKGSVFITFKDKESCQKFIEAEKFVYKDAEILRKWQKDYLEEKSKEYQEKKAKRAGKKGGKDATNGDNEDDESKENENGHDPLPTGTVLKLEGLGETTTREDIKAMLAKEFEVQANRVPSADNPAEMVCDIAFITYEKGQTEAKVRFKQEDFAKKLLEKWTARTDSVTINDQTVTASVLEGEEEKQYLLDAVREMKVMKNRFKGGRGHKRKNFGGRGGHGGKRARAN